tara:strand:- start:19483 stop:20136 length:654 start_codon:yes stop_codon:yes gene_type:complete
VAAPDKFFFGQPTIVAVRKLKTRLPKEMQLGLKRHAKFVVDFIRKERFGVYPGYENEDKGRTFLYRRTGKLSRSIKAIPIADKGGMVIEAGRGTGDPRAVDNEFGKVYTGRIFVPLGDNITPTGRRRFSTVEEALAGGATYWRSPSTGKTLVRRLKSRGKKTGDPFEYLFVLVNKVKIPPRFKFGDTIRRNPKIVEDRRKRMVNATRKAITSVGFKR